MRNKLIYSLIIFLGVFASCSTKDFEELNTDKKNPVDVPGNYVFSQNQYLLAYHMTTVNVGVGIFNMMAQYITETTYTDEANWDLVNRRIPDNFYRRMYLDLNGFKTARTLIEKEVAVGEGPTAEKSNRIAIIKLMNAYTFQVLVDIFGDVPYSEALNPLNTLPKYDDDAAIYASLMDSVAAAVNSLNDAYGSFGSADLIYGGDVAAWKKFGNALLIKLAVSAWDHDAAKAKSVVEAAYSKTFTGLSESAYFNFTNGSPYYSPIYEDLVASGRKDFVVCNTLFRQMDVTDPRIQAYADDLTLDASGNVTNGGTYAASNNYATGAHVDAAITAAGYHGFLLTYDEILFYLAEAASKGANVGNTAATLYDNAVTSSFQHWTGSTAGASAYLALRPFVDVKSVAKEMWIAMYMRGLVGWTTYRRVDGAFVLDVPANNTPGISVIPTRFTYPVNEQTLNADAYKAASTAIGGDKLTTKIFWDKN